jgi:hypothetical protein
LLTRKGSQVQTLSRHQHDADQRECWSVGYLGRFGGLCTGWAPFNLFYRFGVMDATPASH